jgi:hypothetical protein
MRIASIRLSAVRVRVKSSHRRLAASVAAAVLISHADIGGDGGGGDVASQRLAAGESGGGHRLRVAAQLAVEQLLALGPSDGDDLVALA